MKVLIFLFTLFLLISCGKEKSELILFEKERSDYNQFINSGSMPAQPNLSIVKTIYNDEYPVEMALYEDGRFYYNLDNLGDGNGTWRYENGVLKLSAFRKILTFDVDMDYTFTITRKDGSQSLLKFRDRKGNRALSTLLR